MRSFIEQRDEFARLYAFYCANHHFAGQLLTNLAKEHTPDMYERIMQLQRDLGHSLDLRASLLKPVQRILKYHLLLGQAALKLREAQTDDSVLLRLEAAFLS